MIEDTNQLSQIELERCRQEIAQLDDKDLDLYYRASLTSGRKELIKLYAYEMVKRGLGESPAPEPNPLHQG